MLRAILIVLFLVLYLIVSLPLLLVEAIISLFRPKWRKRPVVYKWVTGGFRCITALSGMRLTVIGKERIPQDEATLFIGNHQSYFDIVVTYGLAPAFTGFIGKKSMQSVPILSWLMVYVNCLFLDRDDIKQGLQTILAAIDYVKEGISIVIYPEGTRNHTPDQFMEFHKGSFKIAQRTGCPIVPVTITGSRDVYENHRPFVRRTDVILEYGEPFRFADLAKDDQKNIHTYTSALIRTTYDKNKASLQAHGG